MSEKKTDKRILRTKRVIKEAFIELLKDKELHKITIQEIADKAEINRVTFYKHYLDVYDLNEEVENDIIVDLGIVMLRYVEMETDEFYEYLIGFIDENRDMFRMIFSHNNTGMFRAKIDKLMEGLFRKVKTEKYGVAFKNRDLEYISYYHTHGCIAVIEKWVNDGFRDSREYIVKRISGLDKHIVSRSDKTNNK